MLFRLLTLRVSSVGSAGNGSAGTAVRREAEGSFERRRTLCCRFCRATRPVYYMM